MKIVTACIPEYFPSVTFFLKMLHADHFVLADNLQYTKHSLVNRTKIRTPNDWQWLTVPVIKSKQGLQSIASVKILPESNWQRKQQTSLKSNYKYAPFFDHYFFLLKNIFEDHWINIHQLDLATIQHLQKHLRLEKEIQFLSNYKINKTGTDRIIDLVKKMNADTYLINASESKFVDRNKLTTAGIDLKIVYPNLKQYRQSFEPFIADLSVLDVLFNLGNESLTFLDSCLN